MTAMEKEAMFPLESIKSYSRTFHDADDETLTRLRDVSIAGVENSLHRTFDDIIAEEGEVPADIQQAVYLMIGTFNENREGTISIGIRGVQELPLGITYLLAPHKNYTV